jgi:hypothetical protein
MIRLSNIYRVSIIDLSGETTLNKSRTIKLPGLLPIFILQFGEAILFGNSNRKEG